MATSSVSNGGGGFTRQMSGATSTIAGVSGAVPTPNAGDQEKALLGNGTWGEVSGKDSVQVLTASGAALAYTSIVIVNSATDVIVTLPQATALSIGKKITIKNIGVGTVNILAFAGDTVDIFNSITTDNASTFEVNSANSVVFIGSTSTGVSIPLHYSTVSRTTTANTAVTGTNWTTAYASMMVLPLMTESNRTLDSNFLISGNTFVIKQAGKYSLSGFVALETTDAYSFAIGKNNTEFVRIYNDALGSTGTISSGSTLDTDLGDLNVGDIIDIRAVGHTGTVRYFSYSVSLMQLPTSVSVPVDIVPEYGFINLVGQSFTTNTFVNSTNGIYTIPSAGTWRLRYDITTDGSGVTVTNSMIAIFDSSDNIVTGSEKARGGSVTVAANVTGEVFVTTTDATTYTLKARVGAASGSFGIINNASFDSTISWEKISGFLASSGQTVDTVSVNLTGSNQSIPGISTDVIFNTFSFGNIPYNTSTGVFALTAGKTYELEATLKSRATTAGYIQYEWVDAVTNNPIPGGINGLDIHAPSTLVEGSSPRAYLMYTPFTNQTVKIRVTGLSGTAIFLDANRCNANIKQLGSSAVITTNYIAEFAETILSVDTTIASTDTNGKDILTFIIPSAGVWEIQYDVNVSGLSNSTGGFWLSDSSNNLVSSSETRWQRQDSTVLYLNYTKATFITTTSAGTYKLRGSTNSTSIIVVGVSTSVTNLPNATGLTKITYKKISGFTPASGQSVDYSGVEQHAIGTATNLTSVTSTNVTTSGTLLTTANRITLAGADISGNLTVNTANGTIAIAKNAVYNIVISVNTQSAGGNGQWGQLVKNNATVISTTSSYNQISSASLQLVFSYTGAFVAGDLIDVRLNANSAGTIGITGYSYSVIQIGSSAYTSLNTFDGATNVLAGVAGGVPAPIAGEQNTFLRGNGTWSKPVFSGARRFANAVTSIPNTGAASLVTTGTVDYTAGTDVTTGTLNTITIVTTGYYVITGSVGIATGSSTANYHARILVNGSTIAQGGNVTSVVDTQTMQVNTTVNLTSGDLVTLAASQNSGGSQNTVSGTTRTYLEVRFVGV
jgi:hypothetical protein